MSDSESHATPENIQTKVHNYRSKRSPNWSTKEIEVLCQFVREHKKGLFSRSAKGSNASKQRLWERVTQLITTTCGVDRHWIQVRKKWKDLSYCARNMQKEADQTNSNDTAYSSTSSDISSPSSISSCEFQSLACVKVETDSSYSVEDVTAPIQPPVVEFQGEGPPAGLQICRVSSQSSCDTNAENGDTSSSNGPTEMSAYEASRLEIEREKLELQRNSLECLKDISSGLRKMNTTLSRLKRRRRMAGHDSRAKRRRAFSRRRNVSASESSDYDF